MTLYVICQTLLQWRIIFISFTESTSLLSNLTSSLFANYDQTVRPYCQGQEKINLSIDMAIRQLIELVCILRSYYICSVMVNLVCSPRLR